MAQCEDNKIYLMKTILHQNSLMNESNSLDYNGMTFEEKFDLAQSLNKGFSGAQHIRLNVALRVT